MLRIDENSKTLVAPQAAEVVQDAPPAPEEILEMACSSWDAFMDELGLPSLKLMARAPMAGVDALAFDQATGRVAVVQFTGGEHQLALALSGAAMVAGLDAAALESINDALKAAVPGDSPQIVLIGGGLEETTTRTLDFLVRRHGMEISAHQLLVFRVGDDKLMTVQQEYPPRENQPDPVAQVHRMVADAGRAVTGAATSANGHSVAPPAA